MNLTVDNFAIINHADIKLDGITVIAGSNNSGKSTVGKILFSIFHSLHNVADQTEKQREKLIYRIFTGSRYLDDDDSFPILSLFGDNLDCENILKKDTWEAFFKKRFSGIKPDSGIVQLKKNIFSILDWPENKIFKEIIQSIFQNVFHQQINSLHESDTIAKISLNIKNKITDIHFTNNSVSNYTPGIDIVNKAVYFSSPLVIDYLNDPGVRGFRDVSMNALLRMLQAYDKRISDTDNALMRSMNKDKLKDIYQLLDEVILGDIVLDGGRFALRQEGYSRPIMLDNLSMGLKAFTVIKMLLESDLLERKDVLVLDEPEIHLHPTWQITYAQIIVLLQKFFDLSIVITTHSNFFLKAIDVYTQKYGLRDKIHYYISEPDQEQKYGITLTETTDNLETIYAKMAEAVHTLRELQAQL